MIPADARAPSVRLLFALRMVRLFAYGLLAVVLVLLLDARGLDEARIGLFLTVTLLGGAVLSLLISTRADRLGRRRMLLLGAALMVLGGAVLAETSWYPLMLAAAVIGVISPTGNEVGPFLAIEQAALSQVVPDRARTAVFGWSHVLGFSANALGALAGGWLAQGLLAAGWSAADSYRALLWLYAGCGLVLGLLALRLAPAVEAPPAAGPAAGWLGVRESRRTVAGLGALFAVDAFGGGFIVQSFVAWWFHLRFGAEAGALGSLLFGANLLSGLSALAAVPLARRIGLVNTMVFTHLPSNVLLMLVPLMPTFPLAAAVLLARHLISQMDVPTRQSYVNAVVPPGERAAANGITTTVRQLGAAAAPLLAAPMLAVPGLASAPFFIAGGVKCAYDLALWLRFRAVRPPEEGGNRP